MASENRRGYEFTPNVRRQLIAETNGICESCREPAEQLFVHHILPIEIARECYPNIPPMIVASALNAMCLCEQCHERENRLALEEEQIEFIVPRLEEAAERAEDDEIQVWTQSQVFVQ